MLTERFCLQKHWCDLTPSGSEALGISDDNAAVLVTAFRLPGPVAGYTIHLANPQWERSVTLQGLPAGLGSLNVVRTGHGQFFQKLPPLAIHDGRLTFTLPAECLTTLTTLEPGTLEPMLAE